MCSVNFNSPNPINGVQNQPMQGMSQSIAQYNGVVRYIDYINTPNPAEMLGRSIVRPKMTRKEIVDKLFSNKANISNKEADDILREFGCDESYIQDLRKNFPNSKKLNLIINSLSYVDKAISGFNFLDTSLDSIEQVYQDDSKIQYLKFFNEDNVKLLENIIKNDDETPYQALLEMAQLNIEEKYSENEIKKIVEKSIEISDLYGNSICELVNNIKPDDCEKYTTERLRANKLFADALGVQLFYTFSDNLKSPELMTPEFLEKFANEYKRLEKLFIASEISDPVADYDEIKSISDKCEELGFDFSKLKQKVQISDVASIVESDKAKDASVLYNALNDETKKYMEEAVFKFLNDDKCLNNPQDCSRLCNEISRLGIVYSDNDYAISQIFNNLPDVMRLNPDADLKKVKEVAEAFVEAGFYPQNSSAYPLFGKDDNGTYNYDDKIAFIKELKEFYGAEDSKYSIQDYAKEPWRDGLYSEMPKQFEKLKKAGMYGKVSPSDLRFILENADNDTIVDKVIKFKDEHFFDNQFFYFDNFTAEEMEKELDYLKEKINENNPEYENLSFDEKVNILEALDAHVRSSYYNKMTFGREYNDENLSLDEQLKKHYYNPEVREFAIELLKKNEKNMLDLENKKQLLNLVARTPEFKDFAMELVSSDFPKDKLTMFFENLNAQNVDFVHKLFKDGKYSNDELIGIAGLGFSDEKSIKTHQELLKDAFENRDLLKNGLDDLSDNDIKNVINSRSTVAACNLVGKGNLESAFGLTIDGFEDVCHELSSLKLSDKNREKLLQKINPSVSSHYLSIANEISDLKEKLNQALGEEASSKISEINAQREKIDAQIAEMKKDLKEKTENSQEYADLKKQISLLQKQSKILGGQAQALYFKSQNASEIKSLMTEIKSKNMELKELVGKYSELSPQVVIDKTRALAAVREISFYEEMEKMIDLIDVANPEKEKLWDETINKKIYEKIGVEYDEKLSEKLDLINCKYLGKMISSNDEFFENMKDLVQVIKDNPDKSVAEAIDALPQNIKTKQKLAQIGVDYEKWVKYDPESFTIVETKLDAEKTKKQAIDSLEEDLNDELFGKLPQNIQDEIFTDLEKIGVTLEKSEKDVFVGDGFNAGRKAFNRLYKDGKPIVFDDLKSIVGCIKDTINKNQFWTTKQNDPSIENARGTLYTHLIKLRSADVDNAKKMKDGEVVRVKVSKTDMNDIKKSLGLGNDGQCCTALGKKFNEHTAPNYIKNKCIGAIELTDNGNFAGNTMIYLAKVDGKPALVLDNIELKTKYQNNDSIRDAFVEYAKKLCAEIGRPDMGIYAGPNRHKLDLSIFPKQQRVMQILGNTGDDKVYLDYDAEHHKIDDKHRAKIEMYQIA